MVNLYGVTIDMTLFYKPMDDKGRPFKTLKQRENYLTNFK
jgi:hypothetical protein